MASDHQRGRGASQREARAPAVAQSSPAAAAAGAGEAAAGRLLQLVGELAASLHPHRRATLRVGLDRSLERDLGFDSLGRVELLLRIERAFQVGLPETLIAEAETPRDLLRAVLAAGGRAARAAERVATPAGRVVETIPPDVATLLEVLEWHCRVHPERPHVLLDDGVATTATITYGALRHSARAVAAGLQARGVADGRAVALMLPTGADYFAAFFGVLYAGCVPVPIYPPFRASQLEDHLRRQAGILANAEAAMLIADAAWSRVADLAIGRTSGLCRVATPAALVADAGAPPPIAPSADLPALIQYTSGSTGDPKGVVLSHANLLANIRAIGEIVEPGANDVFVSWLPLYHDMGLIGAWLGTLYYAAVAVILSPLRFLGRPENWLWAMHRYRATLSAAPNFAYELCLHRVEDDRIAGLDLSSLRLLMNGAEAVGPATVREFPDRFARYGLRPRVMTPVYGLAECSLGLAFTPPGRGPRIERVQRGPMAREGRALPAGREDAAALEFVGCGYALPRHQVRIVDPMGRELGDRHQGALEFRGPSATRGYFRNPERSRELFDDGWLRSGDLAYSVDGELFVTGRSKDIVIRAGRHIFPEELEKAVARIPGVRKGCVAVFGAVDRAAGTERVVIVAETRASEPAERERIRETIDATAAALLEGPADDVVLAAPGTVPKTSSGKIRRAACRERYERGLTSVPPAPVWLQLLRLRRAGLGRRLARLAGLAKAQLYAGWWWSVVAGCAAIVWPLGVLLPNRGLRWRALHAGARLCLRMLAIPLDVVGGEDLPEGGAVFVANHSSYLDVLVLSALLGRPPVFVAKQELTGQFFAGTFLRRIGTQFVERTRVEKGAAAAAQELAAVRAGEWLVSFPEGTLTRRPGLLPFHMGPFLAAAAAGVPVVPLSLRGTRSILRGDQWFPRRGAVQIAIHPAIRPQGPGWDAALALRDAARATILERVGEPDLGSERLAP